VTSAIGLDKLPGLAIDIGVAPAGGSGLAWVIGTNPVGPSDFGIFRWVGTENRWEEVDGGGVRISVGGDGTPWVVNASGGIFRRPGGPGGRWEQLPGAAKDIGALTANLAWVIGTNLVDSSGDCGIFIWTGTVWEQVDGAGVAIAVQGNGTPWVVNAGGGIFRRPGGRVGRWEQLPGAAKDVGVSFGGSAWVIGTNPVGSSGDFGIFNWDGTQWLQRFLSQGGARIAVDEGIPGSGRPWVVNSARQIFEGDIIPG
jgi:hypothetical protein